MDEIRLWERLAEAQWNLRNAEQGGDPEQIRLRKAQVAWLERRIERKGL